MSEYIGRRIVPVHGGVWDGGRDYEELTIVLYEASGDSYISRRPVPAGTVIGDKNYWMLYSLYSQQIANAVKEMQETDAAVRAELSAAESRMENRVTEAETLTNQNKSELSSRMDGIDERLDANVSASTDADADYAAEVVDARVNSKGETYDSLGPLYNTSATEKIKRVTQKEFPAKMVVATQTRRRETPMSHYQHLTISERESIWENKLAGKSLREIARQTGRSVSTISRELKRNGTSQKYRPSEAQKKYERRRKRCRRKKLLQEGELKDLVVRLLTQQQWSPEQIAQRIELERGKKLVSYATIYRALHKGLMEAKGTRKNRHGRYPMEKHLRRKGWRGKGKGQKSRHFVHQTIEERPEEANRRSEIGHWEGDLVYSSFYKLYVVTLVDRKSRFLLTGISYSRKAQEVSDVICRLLKKLPEKHVRSLTLDRGSEFSEHDQITKAFPSLQIYFAHPMSPWERGSNEQINGLLRQYIPKNTYQVPFSAERLAEFTEKLNHRPRKCLNWNSPSEIFSNLLLHLT